MESGNITVESATHQLSVNMIGADISVANATEQHFASTTQRGLAVVNAEVRTYASMEPENIDVVFVVAQAHRQRKDKCRVCIQARANEA